MGLGNVPAQNLSAVGQAVHLLRETADKFIGFFVSVDLQFFILGIVKAHGHAQHQQRTSNAPAQSSLAHAAAKAGADLKCSLQIYVEIFGKGSEQCL